MVARAASIEHANRIFRGGLGVSNSTYGDTNVDPSGTGLVVKETFTAPAVGATTAVHAAVTDTAVQVDVTTGITNPDVPRNITATSGGTAGDIKAVSVIITGTDVDDKVITETLPAFTVNSATTVVGNKAFKTVTNIRIPAHDGTGATTAIGTGAKLGLSRKYARDTCLAAYLADVREATLPTVANSIASGAVSSNTMTLSTTLNSTDVVAYFAAS